MADWPIASASRFATYGLNSGSTLLTAVTTSTANTKGSYSQLLASTDFNAAGFWLNIVPTNNGASIIGFTLIDIAIGGSGSEQVIVSNFAYQGQRFTTDDFGVWVFIPIAIPAGSRISARAQDSIGSWNIYLGVTIVGAGFTTDAPGSKATNYGANTATSKGVSITPGTNTYGSWTQITSSTTADMRWVIITCNANAADSTFTATGNWYWSLGIGGSGSEVEVLGGFQFFGRGTTTPTATYPSTWGPFPLYIPAGTRIAARSSLTKVNGDSMVVPNMNVYGIG